MKRLLCALALFAFISLVFQPASAAGLSYREIARFAVRNSNPEPPDPSPVYLTTTPALQTDRAASLDFNSDGKTLAVGYRGIVRLWDIATGAIKWERSLKIQPYQDNPNWHQAGSQVRFSPNGEFLAVTAFDELQIFKGEKLIQRCGNYVEVPISWSPDSRHVAGGSPDGSLLICNIQDGKIRSYSEFYTTATEWSPDGKHIAVLSDMHDLTSYLRFFDIETQRAEYTVGGYLSGAWSPDGRKFIGNNFFAGLRVWDVSTRRAVADITGGGTAIAMHPGGEHIAVLDRSNQIQIQDASAGWLLAPIPLATSRGQEPFSEHGRLRWSRDGVMLAAIDSSDVVHIWQESGKQPLAPPATNTPRAVSDTIVPTPIWVPVPTVVSPVKPSVLPSRIIQRKQGVKSLQDWTVRAPEPPYLLGAYTLDWDAVRSHWVIFPKDNPRQKRTLPVKQKFDVRQPVLSPDGHWLAFVHDVANVSIYDLQTSTIVYTIHQRERIDLIVWHPTRPLVATLGGDYVAGRMAQMLIAYDLQTRQELYHEEVYLGLGPNILWPDETDTLLFLGIDVGLQFFNLHTIKQVEGEMGSGGLFNGAISPDHRYLAFTRRHWADQFTLNFLDIRTQTVILRYVVPEDTYEVAWSPDGQQVFTVDQSSETLTTWGN